MNQGKISVAIIGAGNRGRMFADLIREFGHMARVVTVAEPRAAQREALAQEFQLPPAQVFASWEEMLARPRVADAAVIATMDREHVAPALACLEQGYHLLLEKPMATTLADCQAIAAAQRRAGTMVSVCHSLRYQKGFAKVKELLAAGRLGRVISIEHTEQVGYFHYPHSFVRGNWGNEGRSSFMLLAKSCHDIDFISYLAGAACRRVSSFGALTWFTAENAPPGSTARCTDGCAVEHECPFSAIRQYVQNSHGWAPYASLDTSREAMLRAIKEGPYGRCVYHADNDVVDHQVVLLDYEGDVTATFTMIAYAEGGRKTRVYGTKAELWFDEATITIRDLGNHNVEQITIGYEPGGHGGGDRRVVHCWLEALRQGEPDLILTGVAESLATHTIVFAAERARREGRLVELTEMEADVVPV